MSLPDKRVYMRQGAVGKIVQAVAHFIFLTSVLVLKLKFLCFQLMDPLPQVSSLLSARGRRRRKMKDERRDRWKPVNS